MLVCTLGVTRDCYYLVVKLWCEMEPPGGRDSRFNLGYSMNLLSGETAPEIYGNPSLGRPSTSLQQLSPRHTMVSSACGGRGLKSDMYDERGMSSQNMGLEACGVNDISEDTYSSLQSKKSPPSNGKKTKGRVKIKMEYIENKLRRYTTFSKRKTGIMKKAYELSTLTGTQVMLLVASETGHVYTFATRKLQPMITSEAGKALIQTCLNSPDPPAGSAGGDQRMSATGFEETELTYNISDEDSKEDGEGFCQSSTSSEEEDQTEEHSDLPEKIHLSSDNHLLPLNKDKAPYRESTTNMQTSTSNSSDPTKNLTPSRELEEKKSTASLATVTSASKIQVQQQVVVPPNVERTATSTSQVTTAQLTSSVPLLMQSVAGANVMTPNITPTSSISPSQIQALPLLVQTPAGVGYATTPEGMILGLLQGPNLVQPQLVAIPMTTASPSQSTAKKDGGIDKR